MTATIPINLAVEDALTEHVLRVVLKTTALPYSVDAVYCKGGFTYLRQKILAFNQAARIKPYLLVTDLDNGECPPDLIENWFGCKLANYPSRKHPNLLFCVAVREIESWLLADRAGFARFLGISIDLVPSHPEQIVDPKRTITQLARRCRYRRTREDIVPDEGSIWPTGPGYTERLASFINEGWNVETACRFSPSLQRAFALLKDFSPGQQAGAPICVITQLSNRLTKKRGR